MQRGPGVGSGNLNQVLLTEAETNDHSAEAAADAALQAGAYPFETCSECRPKVSELLKLVYLEESPTLSVEDGNSPQKYVAARISIHRWLAAHQRERGHAPNPPKKPRGGALVLVGVGQEIYRVARTRAPL